MTHELRAVFDTNALVSAALLRRSVPRRAFDLAIAQGRLLLSEATLGEIDEVLHRPKFDRYTSQHDRLEFLAELLERAELVVFTPEIKACRDPKDDKFLSLALGGKANCLVSGDADLLVLNPFQGIRILTPQQFLAAFSH